MAFFGFMRQAQPTQTTAPVAETRSLADPDAAFFELFGAVPAAAGFPVTAQTALRVPAVAAGVKAISEACGILPLHAYRRAADGSRERDAGHASTRLLNGDANPWTRGAQLRELLVADAIVHGNGFGEIVRTGDEPRELHRLHPQNVTVEIDARTSEPRYKVTIGGGHRFIPFTDILHLRAPSPLATDAITGRSPILEAKDAISILIALQQHAAQLFKNGGRPSGILSFPQKLGAETAKRIKASWQAATSGQNAGGTAVLEEDGKFQPLAFSSTDAQFMELFAFCIAEVARVLRVPPVLLADYSRQTLNNAETGGQQFLTYTLAPWLERLEAEVTLKLIAPDDRETLFVEHLTDALLRSDFASRATAFGQYRSMGVMTANEVRAGLNLPPMAGGDTLQNPYTSSAKAEPAPKPGKTEEEEAA